jgi:hypothetical protein
MGRAASALPFILVAPCAATAAASPSKIIYSDTSIGGFHGRQDFGRLSQAIDVFGEPASARRTGQSGAAGSGHRRMASGHVAMVSHPDEVASLIETAVKAVSAGGVSVA